MCETTNISADVGADYSTTSEPTVVVRRQWNDHNKGTVSFDSIADLHWSDISGGIQQRAPRNFLCGYIFCNDILEGGVSHSCSHGPPPHRIKVCVVQKDNSKAVFQRLITRQQYECSLAMRPFAVDLGQLESTAELESWLTSQCEPDCYVRVTAGWWREDSGWGKKGRPIGSQIWFNSHSVANEFSRAFNLRFLGHQNASKQLEAARHLCSNGRTM